MSADDDAANGYIDVSFAKDGGVKKKILQEAPEGARGPPPSGMEVEAHYTGKVVTSYMGIGFSMIRLYSS
jgi:hypothetical protein